MLQLIYILAFTVIAFLAISNLIKSLMNVSYKSARNYRPSESYSKTKVSHPELVDEQGRPIKDPLLVMRSVSVEDARQKLDAIYKASPGKANQDNEIE